ncbi:hybrid sensor histidine kinase/response regulator [Methylobacterium planeticum]|uniref:Chemotaxis protein CheA n=1 Tax=Methylobacterium planeticum TaxID=2615211 RepID=A0A6N6MQ15_9HYPH|nr:response regulator [Methylobacterium planeticum]KAB1071469.1 response regulator [Methylobacterium planeticum]
MDIRQQLLAAFEVEHREHIDAIRAALAGGAEGRPPDWNDIFRRAHSLKGAARAVDLPPVEAVAHRLETLFERIVAGATRLDREATRATHLALDRIEAYVADLKTTAAPAMPGDALAALDGRLAAGPPAEPETAPAEPGPPSARPEPRLARPEPEPAQLEASSAQPEQTSSQSEPAVDPALALLRVPADAVEALTRATHELTSTLGGEGLVADGLSRLGRNAAELRRRAEATRERGALATLARVLHEQGSEAGTAALAAVRADLRALEAALAVLGRETLDLARRQTGVASAVEGAAARIRTQAERLALVPAETVFGGFARSLRETAREQDREIEVSVRGLDLPVDRGMLQILKDPVLHALRNALSHGAEAPEARRRAGKPAALTIAFEVAVRGGRLLIAVSDDGRGPNLPAIEATARARGLLAPGDAADPDTLLGLVFEPGFSTAASVDTLSGRGFGLSVVADAVRALRGSVRLEPRAPWGTALTMSLPLSASRRSVLLVEAGGATFGLPGSGVERLLRLDRAALGRAMGRAVARIEGPGGAELNLPVIPLADLVGLPARDAASETTHLTALLLREAGERFVLAVDRLVDVRTLLVLPAPPIGADARLFSGTVILPGDVPALVLDPQGVVDRVGETRSAGGPPGGAAAGASEPRGDAGGTMPGTRRSTILVVDDSITTRTLEKSILEAAGYRVVVCVDGQDALDRLRAAIETVDLVVADVEMPRLDGFGLLKALRAEDAFARLPVILMTSRGDAEDVARGLDLGADAYLTKQKFDQRQLLDTIGQLL